MKKLVAFYDRYHQKNHQFVKVISRDNFTYRYILDFLHSAFTNGFAHQRILDVGCGVGTMALYLSDQGAQVTGVDISERAISIAEGARRALNNSTAQFIHGEVKSGRAIYDIVTTFEVIEHVENERDFLKKIHSNLKKNGWLVLSTPSRENVLYRLGFYRGFDQEVGHLRRYTKADLKRLLSNNSFKVVAMREVEGPLRNLLYTTKLGFLIRFIRGPLIPLFHTLDMLSGALFGFADIQVLAKKV